MVKSGSFNTNAFEVRYLTFRWNLVSLSERDNTSTIHWEIAGGGGSATSWYYTNNIKIIVDGEIVYTYSGNSIQLKGDGKAIASGDKVILHKTDGSRSFTASASCGIYYTSSANCKGNGLWELPLIPRYATIVEATNFNDTEQPQVIYTNPAGSSLVSLEAAISLDGTTDNIKYRAIDKAGTSYTFALTEEEINILKAGVTKADNTEVFYLLRSKRDGLEYIDKIKRTFTISDAKPTIVYTYEDINSQVVNITGDDKIFIKKKSKIRVAINATAKYGATITSTSITSSGLVFTTPTGVIQVPRDNVIIYSAVDSRGNKTEEKVTINLLDYYEPTIALEVDLPNALGEVKYSVEGIYFNQQLGKTLNTLTLQYRYKQDLNYTEWVTTPKAATVTENSYKYNGNIEGLNYKEAVTVLLKAYDAFLDEVLSKEITVLAIPVFDWSKKDFNFNVPVNINGELTVNNKPISGGSVNFLDIYPVGAIYITTSGVNPGTIFGGTWKQIKGKFLWGTEDDRKTTEGGAENHTHTTAAHTLTIEEIPSHNHEIGVDKDVYGGGGYRSLHGAGVEGALERVPSGYTGGGQPHTHGDTGTASNMPPWYAVYIWERTK